MYNDDLDKKEAFLHYKNVGFSVPKIAFFPRG